MVKVLNKVDQFIEKGTVFLLAVCVIGMLFFSLLSISARWLQLTFVWVDPLVRHLVFFSAFLGGLIAVGEKKHIGIDILPKFLEAQGKEKYLRMIQTLSYIAGFLIMLWLGKAGVELVKSEIEYGKEAFLGIHSSVMIGIIPFGSFLLSLRFGIHAILLNFKEAGNK